MTLSPTGTPTPAGNWGHGHPSPVPARSPPHLTGLQGSRWDAVTLTPVPATSLRLTETPGRQLGTLSPRRRPPRRSGHRKDILKPWAASAYPGTQTDTGTDPATPETRCDRRETSATGPRPGASALPRGRTRPGCAQPPPPPGPASELYLQWRHLHGDGREGARGPQKRLNRWEPRDVRRRNRFSTAARRLRVPWDFFEPTASPPKSY